METIVETAPRKTPRRASLGDAVIRQDPASDHPRAYEGSPVAQQDQLSHETPTDEEVDNALDHTELGTLGDDSDLDTSQNLDSSQEKKHPKATRQRTSPEDKAILEAAYRENRRPTKEKRDKLMGKTKLSAKGIQIWFQNRRQTDRRKEKIWSPTPLSFQGDKGFNFMVIQRPASSSQPNGSSSTSTSPVMLAVPLGRRRESLPGTPVLAREGPRNSTEPVPEPPAHGPPVPDQEAIKRGFEEAVYQATGQVGYLANRRNLSASFRVAELSTGTPKWMVPTSASNSGAVPRSMTSSFGGGLIRSQSMTNMRLSTSLHGQAQVIPHGQSPQKPQALEPKVQGEGSPPSTANVLPQLQAPRTDVVARQPLERSQSMGGAVRLPPISDILAPCEPPRLGRGRSRDARFWESVALTERNDELTAQAEDESQGSALAELSLLRSTNSAQTLKASSHSKRTASSSRTRGTSSRPTKRSRGLGRAASSAARLEAFADDSEERSDKAAGNLVHTPKGDSDKENWSPGSRDGVVQRAVDRRPYTHNSPNPQRRRGARPLGESSRTQLSNLRANTAPSLPGTLDRGKGSKSVEFSIMEDQETVGTPSQSSFRPEEDEDIQRFMSREGISPSKKDHMEGVACLMHLSRAMR